mgnify:CR=1 FL=1
MQVSVEGKMVEVSDGASCADALKEGLSGKRFKAAIACKAGDTLLDLTAPVPTTTETLTLTPVTADTPEGLGLIRHSAAHVMAAAVKKLFPAAKVTIGPSIENGFYYDFDVETPFSPDQFEAIEAEMEKEISCVDSAELGKASRIVDAAGRYIEFCKATFPNELSLSELKIVVDCANGATYHIAPNVLRELGANVIAIGCEPNGVNINAEVGATAVRALQARVLAEKADLGIAFDGDGDRVIMVDHEGNKVDGDQIMYIIAREGLRQGQLRGGAVGTLMSNMGLELALKQLGIPFARAKVGDRYVLEKMQEKGWRIGAENSGHVILLDKTTTGDGIVAGLQVLAAMARNHMSLHDLCSGMKMFPQILVNVRYTAGSGDPLEHESVKAVTAEVEAALGSRGRVLLRKSGTEPLIRVMVEGEDEAQVTEFAHRIADAVKAV